MCGPHVWPPRPAHSRRRPLTGAARRVAGLRPNSSPCGPRRSGRAPSSAFSSALFFVSTPEMEVIANSVLGVVRPRRENSFSLLLSLDLTIHGSFCAFRGPGKGPLPCRPPTSAAVPGPSWRLGLEPPTAAARGRTVGPVCPAGDGHARLRLARPVTVFTARYAAGCCGLGLSLRAQLGGRKHGKL